MNQDRQLALSVAKQLFETERLLKSNFNQSLENQQMILQELGDKLSVITLNLENLSNLLKEEYSDMQDSAPDFMENKSVLVTKNILQCFNLPPNQRANMEQAFNLNA